MLSTLYTRQRATDVLVYLKKKGKREFKKQENLTTTKVTILLSHAFSARDAM
jgi:hypothetical protein